MYVHLFACSLQPRCRADECFAGMWHARDLVGPWPLVCAMLCNMRCAMPGCVTAADGHHGIDYGA